MHWVPSEEFQLRQRVQKLLIHKCLFKSYFWNSAYFKTNKKKTSCMKRCTYLYSLQTMSGAPTSFQVHHVLESPSCNNVKSKSDAQNKWMMLSFQNLGTKPALCYKIISRDSPIFLGNQISALNNIT